MSDTNNDTNLDKLDKPTVSEPYKKEEFDAFLKTLEDAEVPEHWENIADALGVTQNTISLWKNHPKAIEAKRKGIAKCLRKMETSGEQDWRMWRERAKMLGIKDEQQVVFRGEVEIRSAISDFIDESTADKGENVEALPGPTGKPADPQ